MKGIAVKIGQKGAFLTEVKPPDKPVNEQVLLKTLYTGVCGTDRGIINGLLNFARPEADKDLLVLGHEGLAQVMDTGENVKSLKPGDLVVPIVRRPGKCIQCKIGRQDNCEDGDFVEAGIRGKDGFMREYFIDDEEYLVKVKDKNLGKLAVLTEPLKNLVKAYEVYQTVSNRSIKTCSDSTYQCKKVIIIGAGPIGILFSMLFITHGFQVTLISRSDKEGVASNICKKIGADFIQEDAMKIDVKSLVSDIFIDTTGRPEIVGKGIQAIKHNGVEILFGTTLAGNFNITGEMLTEVVEKNITIFGTVDGAKQHYIEALNYLSMWKEIYGNLLEEIITDEDVPEGSIEALNGDGKGEIKRIIRWS